VRRTTTSWDVSVLRGIKTEPEDRPSGSLIQGEMSLGVRGGQLQDRQKPSSLQVLPDHFGQGDRGSQPHKARGPSLPGHLHIQVSPKLRLPFCHSQVLFCQFLFSRNISAVLTASRWSSPCYLRVLLPSSWTPPPRGDSWGRCDG
jgi:hypothetical protein